MNCRCRNTLFLINSAIRRQRVRCNTSAKSIALNKQSGVSTAAATISRWPTVRMQRKGRLCRYRGGAQTAKEKAPRCGWRRLFDAQPGAGYGRVAPTTPHKAQLFQCKNQRGRHAFCVPPLPHPLCADRYAPANSNHLYDLVGYKQLTYQQAAHKEPHLSAPVGYLFCFTGLSQNRQSDAAVRQRWRCRQQRQRDAHAHHAEAFA